MKKISKTKNLILASLGVLIFSNTQAASLEAKLERMKITQCTADKTKCTVIEADQAISSHITSLHSLTKIDVKIFNKQNKLIQNLKADQGYLDISSQRIVLVSRKTKNSQEEVVVDLKNLSVEKMVMK